MNNSDKHCDKALIEARARIFWGHSATEVQTWLQAQGITREQMEPFITLCLQEYAANLRKDSIKDFVFGSILLSISLVIIALLLQRGHWRTPAYFAALGGYGIWRIITGIGKFIDSYKIR